VAIYYERGTLARRFRWGRRGVTWPKFCKQHEALKKNASRIPNPSFESLNRPLQLVLANKFTDCVHEIDARVYTCDHIVVRRKAKERESW
jgi:hypothetical protein